MENYTGGIPGFADHGPLAGAAWDMVIRANPSDILKSKPILDLVELSGIPSNHLLIKGMVVRGGGHVPLVDARMPLSLGLAGQSENVCALIVDIEGVEVGLIVGGVVSA
jgi:chemotaxis signal transduction protein